MVTVFDYSPGALDWLFTIIPALFLLAMTGTVIFFTVKKIRSSDKNTGVFGWIIGIGINVVVIIMTFYVFSNFAVNLFTMVKATKSEKTVLTLQGENKISSVTAEYEGAYYYTVVFSDGENKYVFDESFSKEEAEFLSKADKLEIYYVVIKGHNNLIRIDADAESVAEYGSLIGQ